MLVISAFMLTGRMQSASTIILQFVTTYLLVDQG